MKPITREEYMKDSNNLHHAYYSQFITESTKQFILNNIGIELLKKSQDKHFNDIIKHSRNTWIWDRTPINLVKARELEGIGQGYLPSQSFHTCVGKACARILLEEFKN